MTTETIEEIEHESAYNLDDDQVAMLAENMATKLRRGEDSRREFVEGLIALLLYEDDVVDAEGPMLDEGRLYFGRAHSGKDGIALFLEDGLSEAKSNAE